MIYHKASHKGCQDISVPLEDATHHSSSDSLPGNPR